MELVTWDPKKVQISVLGRVLKGYAPGSFIQVAPDSDSFSDSQGVDGEPARWASGNPFSLLTLMLMATARDNDFLSNLRNLDLVTNSSIFPVVISTEAMSGSPATRMVAGRAWIKRLPSLTFGNEPNPTSWQIRMLNLLADIQGLPGDDLLIGGVAQ